LNVRKILATPVRISVRSLMAALVLALLCAGTLLLVGANLPPPQFVVSAGEGSVNPIDYPFWREASDRLVGRKYVALTFDDGFYSDGIIDESILDVLRWHHAHAIFFLVCGHLNEASDRVLSEIANTGNIIGNHSYSHQHLNRLNPVDLQQEVEGCSERIASLTGHRPYFFRPPFGETSIQVAQSAHSAGMKQVLWNANSEDSWLKKPDQILSWGLEQTADRSILLMHDRPSTAVALDRLLTALEQRGFRFVLPIERPPTDIQ
jgi:peptidoglycan/xylan/chitin deacetylase (PgdA/CDA1 family)